MQRHFSAARQEPRVAAPFPVAPLAEAPAVDLLTLRLVLLQHLEELRLRGVPEDVLRPVEDELRRYRQTIEQLTEDLA